MDGLREALDDAFEQHEEGSSSEPADQIPASPADTATPTAPIEPNGEAATPEPKTAAERARDAQGRFAKPDGTPMPPEGQTPPVAPPAQPQAPTDRIPAGVPATVREIWNTIPPAAREFFAQRDLQVQQAMSQTVQARQFTQQFQQAVQPFMPAIQMEAGGDPIKAVTGLMQVASGLRFGTPIEKAQIVAHLVNTYGVDIEALDGALVGVLPQQGQQPQGFDPSLIQREVQNALAPFMQQAQARRAQMEQQTAGQVASEIEQFAADAKNEFFGDVRELMADVMEIAERQGRQVSLADAYKHACLLHPEVQKVILARQTGRQAQSLTQAAQRARSAAVSVKGAAPVGNPAPAEPSSIRDAIEAAIESQSRV